MGIYIQFNNITIHLLDLKWERVRGGDTSQGNKIVLLSRLKKLAGRGKDHSETKIHVHCTAGCYEVKTAPNCEGSEPRPGEVNLFAFTGEEGGVVRLKILHG